MANRKITLTKEGTARLEKVMIHLDLPDNRPEAIRIALVKGLIDPGSPPTEVKGTPGGFTFGDGTIAKELDYLMFKHLIIEKLQKNIDDDKQIDKYIHIFAEHGLAIMDKEIDSLSDLDNYMLYLVEAGK